MDICNSERGGIKIDNKKLTEFTLIDIIERHIKFTRVNTLYDKEEYDGAYDKVQLSAFAELLIDAKEMREIDFVDKYKVKITTLGNHFDQLTIDDKSSTDDKTEIERLSGYNNAIVAILACIDPLHEFDLES